MMRMFEGRTVGVRTEETTTDNPDVQVAFDAVRRLNGKDRSCLSLEGDDNRVLMISGGNDDRYQIVFTINIDEELYYAVDDSRQSDEELYVVTGGQGVTLPANQCLRLPGALSAVGHFVATSAMAPQLDWRRST